MGRRERIKSLLGLNTDEYAKSFFNDNNVRSSLTMSIIIIVFTLAMAISSFGEMASGSVDASDVQIQIHFVAYALFLGVTLFNLWTCIQYVRGNKTGHEKAISTVFSVICIAFGIYISIIDYAIGNQILVFVSMILFASCLQIWRPFTSILTISLSFLILYFLMSFNSIVSAADTLRVFVLWVSIIAISLSIYYQRYHEAEKNVQVNVADDKISKFNYMDNITGVANMDFFGKRAREVMMEHSSHPGSKIFMFLDVENFKVINSRYGYASGNAFLTKVAGMMTDTFPDALIARQGDDHFVILTERKGAKQKINSLRLQIYNFNPEIQIGLKVGAYVPHSSDCDPNQACDNARLACQYIKKKYDQDYCEYDNDMDSEYRMRQYIVNNVDTALDRGDIKVYYQPVVWARNGKLCGYEALVKWQDPQYGFLSPGVFIPVLEEYRQVHKVDMIVVDTVFRDIRKLLDQKKPVVPVSLNFSRLDFELTDVVDMLESCASTYSVSRDYIHVEVTESALSDNLDTLQDDLSKLKKLGYPLWLDDFGSGYSSLNVLKDFNFDVMKIDMVFLSAFDEKREKTKAVLKNVVNMASDLGMHTLTEGVETKEQFQYLREIGCERLQGYLFGKPMPLDEIMVKISAGTLPVSEEFLNV